MSRLAYLFERFPSFTQTFCYREVAELQRQRVVPALFSIRRPAGELPQPWDQGIVKEVQYLPADEVVVREVDRALQKRRLPAEVAKEIETWGRKTDFLRLYQAAWLGPRLKALGMEHLHVHFAGMAARTAWWIRRFFAIGFSFTAHANDIFAPKAFDISLAELVRNARAVVTVSHFGVRFLRDKFPDAADKIVCVYNGIDLGGFRETDFSAAPPKILSVGRLIEKKGFSDLIESCRLLRDRGLAFHCEIIGEGPLEEQLRSQIERAGLTTTLSLAGPRPQEEVVSELARSTVFALPSVTEQGGGMDNLPTVVMEAMAAGLPVVSTAIGGIPEMVVANRTGFLVPERNPVALADALAGLLEDHALVVSMGKEGRARAAELFTIQKNVADLRGLFHRLASEVPLPWGKHFGT